LALKEQRRVLKTQLALRGQAWMARLALQMGRNTKDMMSLLRIVELRVDFVERDGRRTHALNGANIEVGHGEVLGVLGESGSGKSTLAKAALRLVAKTAQIMAGTIEFEGRNLLELEERDMAKLRGARVAMVPQDPGLALNPVMKAGDQIAEVIRAHRGWNWRRCRDEAGAFLERVHLSAQGREMYDRYPHQLSGGQQQRVVIAQALACQPSLVIADEPTASLDSDTEKEILRLFAELTAERKMSLLLITHDPRILRDLADRVVVMYAGRVVEEGLVGQILREPRHPYTRALLDCAPAVFEEPRWKAGMRLPSIEGSPPSPEFVPVGCSFAPRCAQHREMCDIRPPSPVETEPARHVECFLYGG
jgi:peptide/nickel transport system ATP-binding protein